MSEDRVEIHEVAALAPQPPIRMREFVATNRKTGEKHAFALEISAPYPVPGWDWACTHAFPGHPIPFWHVHRARFGVDAWQALNSALFIARAELEGLSQWCSLTWLDGTPYDPEQRF